MRRALGLWLSCGMGVFMACTSVNESADMPPDDAVADPGERRQTKDGAACLEAIGAAQACMLRSDFDASELAILAYQQTTQGPCGSCHRLEPGLCEMFGYDEDAMFEAWSTELCVGQRLFTCVFDDDGAVVDLTPTEEPLQSPDALSHPSGLFTIDLAGVLADFLDITSTRWRNGQCL